MIKNWLVNQSSKKVTMLYFIIQEMVMQLNLMPQHSAIYFLKHDLQFISLSWHFSKSYVLIKPLLFNWEVLSV